MNNIENVMREYEEQREKSRADLEYRKKMLYNKIPRLKEIEDELVKLSVEITKAILSHRGDSQTLIEELQRRQMDYKIEKAEILSIHNYPIDYLDIKYKCKECSDTGFVNGQKCKCFIQKLITYHYKQSNLNENFKRENFDQFRFEFYSNEKLDYEKSPRENIKDIYMKCIKYVDSFDNTDENLFFIGRPGLGKTFLCNAIAKELLERGKSVIYQPSSDLIDLVRKYKFDFDNEQFNSRYIEELYSCDLLIIDDLGTELSTQFSGLVIYNILNRRILKNKKMIISTNLDIDEITKIYSERIYSRIFGHFTLLEFFGEDIRLKMHKII